jgi:hypothetical protein
VRTFLSFSIHSKTHGHGKTLFPYCAESLRWILIPDARSDHKKRITERCSSLVQTESRTAMVYVTVATKELTYQLETCAAVIRRKPRLAMRAKTKVLPTETQVQIKCG